MTAVKLGAQRTTLRLVAAGVLFLMLQGCAPMDGITVNLDPDPSLVRSEIDRMTEARVSLERPVVVLGGWHSPAWVADGTKAWLVRLTTGERSDVLAVSYPWAFSIETAADEAVSCVERRWPSDDSMWTTEVDVVAISMGGIVGRTAEVLPPDGDARKRLRVRRLFTLGTPHRGAATAKLVAPDAAAQAMRPGSSLLASLDEALAASEMEIIPYTHANDRFVGAVNTSPPGCDPVATDGTWLISHFTVGFNKTILVDIARRLRGEPSLVSEVADAE